MSGLVGNQPVFRPDYVLSIATPTSSTEPDPDLSDSSWEQIGIIVAVTTIAVFIAAMIITLVIIILFQR